MRFSVLMIALIASASAVPHGKHFHSSQDPVNTLEATGAASTAAAVTDSPTNQRGRHRTNGAPESSQTAATTAAAAPVTQSKASSEPISTASVSSNSPGSVNPSLVPEFGQQSGLQPDGAGNCKADSGKTIPCQCPPDRNAFIAKLSEFVKAGNVLGRKISFPTSDSNSDALARIDVIISTLQNFSGKVGQGCPAASAPNFAVVQCNLLKATGGTCSTPAAGG